MKPETIISTLTGVALIAFALIQARQPAGQPVGEYEDLESRAGKVTIGVVSALAGMIFIGIALAAQFA